MKTTTYELLPTTSCGTPSGNYDGSSQDWAGVPQQAANYYGAYGGLQTVAYYLNQFQGLIRLEATLETDPTSNSDWFEIGRFDSTNTQTTNNFAVNITGNFTWIRARVEGFDYGTITKLMLSY